MFAKTANHLYRLTTLQICLLAQLFAADVSEGADRSPNIILIVTDDLGYGDLGCYGAEGNPSPHIDRMAKEGMRFSDFYVASPVCSASRAAILTGRYPIRTGVTGVISANTKKALPTDEITLAEYLKSKEYATAIFGKWHLGNTPDVWPLKQGFDEWFGTIGSNDMGKGRPSLEMRRKGKAGVELVQDEKVIEVNPDQRFLTRRYTQKAVEFIKENSANPFFLYIPHNMPHTPLFVSDSFSEKSKNGLYGDVISEIDWSVGEVLKALRETKIEDQTIVLFTSDNGPWLIFGNHGGSAGILSGGKKQTLEGGMRVPFIVRWQTKIPAGRLCSKMVTALDLLPTLLSFSGVKQDKKNPIDGRDVGALFLGKPDNVEEVPFYFFYEEELRAVRYRNWKLQQSHIDRQAPDPKGIGNDGVRGSVRSVTRQSALFDLATDPQESKDVSENQPEALLMMQGLLEKGIERNKRD